MSKSTNKQQIEMLVNMMQSHPEIAQGFHKGSKEVLNRFWQKIEEELNSAGPPTKCIAEWKKVWSDQKKYVRQKAASNLKHSRGTGGGPNLEYKFSATERTIFELIGMKESVAGVGKICGLPSQRLVQRREDVNESGMDNEESVNECIAVSVCEVVNVDAMVKVDEVVNEVVVVHECEVANETTTDSGFFAPETPTPEASSFERPTSSKKVGSKRQSSEILQEELSIQRELCDTIKGAVSDSKEQKENLKKIYRAMDRMYDLKKKHFKEMQKLKKEKMEEMKRHNLVMESLMLRQVEKLWY